MIWAAIWYYGALGITIVHDNVDSKKYCTLSGDILLLPAAETLRETCTV